MRRISFFFALTLIISSTLAAQEIVSAKKGVEYGAGTRKKGAVSIPQMVEQIKQKGVYQGRIKGEVIEVCQEKGCWMRLKVENSDPMMVRFRDYGFFMPKNIVGHVVVLEGEAKEKEVSVKLLQHYAEDAGKNREEVQLINAPKKEIQFIAKGVLVIK